MESQIVEEVKNTVKNWWVSLIMGVLFIGLAILLMVKPGAAYVSLSMVLSICIFTAGILETAFAVSNRKTLSGWGWYLTGGIVDLLIGFVMMCLPVVSMAMIPFIIALWLMFRGVSTISVSIEMNRFSIKNWGWYLVLGILIVGCSIFVIFNPLAGAFTAVYVTAFAFLMMGIFRIMLAFGLRDLYKHGKDLKAKIDELSNR